MDGERERERGKGKGKGKGVGAYGDGEWGGEAELVVVGQSCWVCCLCVV